MDSFEIILEKYDAEMSREEKVSWTEKKNTIFKELLKNMRTADLSEEVKTTLDTLRAQGLLLAIGSSSKNAGFILKQIGLGDYFDAVSDGNNITKSKPDPEVFLKAAKYLGKEPKDCLVVEDAKAGVQAAKAGGMDCAAVGEAVKCKLSDYQLSTFSQLLEAVKNSTKGACTKEWKQNF